MSNCIARCNADMTCVSITVAGRFCNLNTDACHNSGLNRNSPSGQFGQDIYVKGQSNFLLQNQFLFVRQFVLKMAFSLENFYNLLCRSDNECSTSSLSWCSKAGRESDYLKCVCSSSHQCVLTSKSSNLGRTTTNAQLRIFW